MTFIKHELKINLKTFLIWTIIVGIMIFSFMLLFPSMESQMESFNKAFSDMGSFTQAFGMDKISFTTPMGFYGVEVAAVLSLGGAMFAAILGIGMLSKEEGGHTTEFLYVTPNKRNYFITTKYIALVLIVLAFNLFCCLMGILSFQCIAGDLEWKSFLLFHLAQFIMHLEIGTICFGASAFFRKNNMGTGIGIAILLYFVHLFANITDKVAFLHYITPYYYADAAEIFSSEKISIAYMLPGLCFFVLAIFIAFAKYNKKDLSI